MSICSTEELSHLHRPLLFPSPFYASGISHFQIRRNSVGCCVNRMLMEVGLMKIHWKHSVYERLWMLMVQVQQNLWNSALYTNELVWIEPAKHFFETRWYACVQFEEKDRVRLPLSCTFFRSHAPSSDDFRHHTNAQILLLVEQLPEERNVQ